MNWTWRILNFPLCLIITIAICRLLFRSLSTISHFVHENANEQTNKQKIVTWKIIPESGRSEWHRRCLKCWWQKRALCTFAQCFVTFHRLVYFNISLALSLFCIFGVFTSRMSLLIFVSFIGCGAKYIFFLLKIAFDVDMFWVKGGNCHNMHTVYCILHIVNCESLYDYIA